MEKIKNNKLIFISAVVLVVALIVSITLFTSSHDFSKQGSYVDVKGLSERIVKADTAIWSLSFDIKSNDFISN